MLKLSMRHTSLYSLAASFQTELLVFTAHKENSIRQLQSLIKLKAVLLLCNFQQRNYHGPVLQLYIVKRILSSHFKQNSQHQQSSQTFLNYKCYWSIKKKHQIWFQFNTLLRDKRINCSNTYINWRFKFPYWQIAIALLGWKHKILPPIPADDQEYSLTKGLWHNSCQFSGS